MNRPSNPAVVVDAIATVLAEQNLRGMVLSGPWGIGKTYLVHRFVSAHPEALAKANLRFAYVSLFGLQSLAEIRSKLIAAALSNASQKSVKTLWQKLLTRIPLPGEVGGIDVSKVGELARSMVEEAVLTNLFVCVDDLERLGPQVRPVDVLGLMSELIEQKSCKCLLVLNKDKLAEQAVRLFEEKVFDLTLEYRPSPSELLPHGLSREEDRTHALPVFEAFSSSNIRVMKRLDWVLRELRRVPFDGVAGIWSTIVRQAAILVVLKFEHGYARAQLENVIARDESAKFMRDLAKESETEPPSDLPAEITGPLDNLNYTDAGFGAFIVDLLELGSLDRPALAAAFADRARIEEHSKLAQRIRDLFASLRGGFTGLAQETVASLKTLLREDLVQSDRYSLVQLCDLLLELNQDAESCALVQQNLTALVTPVPPANRAKNFREFTHLWASGILDSIAHVPEPSNETLIDAFNAVSANPSGWDPKFGALARATDNELRELLLGLRFPDAMARIRRARDRAGRADDLDESDRKLLVEKFDRVLEEIAAMNPVFRIMVRDYATKQTKRANMHD